MPNTNASFSPVTRASQFQAQLKKLEALGHRQEIDQELAQFDEETEQLLIHTFGTSDKRLETYKYASLGEAETMVNLPESAQEQAAQDVPKKALQQRRQVLEGIISELHDSEETEDKALTGEDHEDPPMM